ncbi:TetR/AcrR family transcriptional regulator [Quadrisphaera sp. DSM 44207]|uniref:TetR/AcrR family transcriptional regulator n=1 Tax=Quadrisphaera sp. DSM 44207 TaxID=1881057 RepID=UPI000886C1C5|nr:TetR/AcrR family transcriptional regulator [Quadrisphaera sp. DSM 44207]SDQ62977.1 transcriptional regulator, TetR family [Quadrisphaera sp. DSM 44207]
MPGATTPRALRADARRNRERILAAAEAAFAQHGAEASLEEVARRAGVGSATLHRHFPSRVALLEAVFHDRVEVLCARARELARDCEPATALAAWLRALGAHASATRGLAASLLDGARAAGPEEQGGTCHAMVSDAGGQLLEAARAAGAVRPDVSLDDLLALVNAISLVAERSADEGAAVRLLDVAIDGMRARPGR